MKQLIYIIFAALALCTAACGKKHSPNSVKAQAQAVDAVNRLATIDSVDTMALQSELLKAEAIRSQYVISGDSIAAEDFDNTFRETLIQKSPRLARKLFSEESN